MEPPISSEHNFPNLHIIRRMIEEIEALGTVSFKVGEAAVLLEWVNQTQAGTPPIHLAIPIRWLNEIEFSDRLELAVQGFFDGVRIESAALAALQNTPRPFDP